MSTQVNDENDDWLEDRSSWGPDRATKVIRHPEYLRFARGTRDFARGPAAVEVPVGYSWLVDVRVDTLARNLAVAGALELSRSLGELFPRPRGTSL